MATIFGNLLRRVPQVIKCSSPTIYKSSFQRNFSAGSILLSPKIQQPAPDFEGTACYKGEFKKIKLSDFKGKYLVFFFYPLDFTFVCPTELIAFDERLEEFKHINTEVVACSVDSHYAHLAWQETDRKKGGLGPLNYPLLSDLTKKISRDYGVLLEDPGIALRGTFIIDPNGVLRVKQVNDLPIGRSVEEVIRLVEACKFNDENGEVCPANWKKGEKTIKPNPKDAKDYFEKSN